MQYLTCDLFRIVPRLGPVVDAALPGMALTLTPEICEGRHTDWVYGDYLQGPGRVVAYDLKLTAEVDMTDPYGQMDAAMRAVAPLLLGNPVEFSAWSLVPTDEVKWVHLHAENFTVTEGAGGVEVTAERTRFQLLAGKVRPGPTGRIARMSVVDYGPEV